ncbi:MAG TPA: MotA/TolQ/ExbB proton channel family protein [Clostridia bacterium]|nr:MotA/TolQ/ExbB proton channel family protein [Clostridia bacterium]
MIKILIQNLAGYDAIIFVAAIINCILFIRILKDLKIVDGHFKQTKFLQNELLAYRLKINEHEHSIERLRDVLDQFTTIKHRLDQISVFYISLTSIFPLLGILGTVVALLNLTDFTNSIITVNFSLALTSTFWGILFGAISKFGEGFFTAKLELYDKLYHEVRSSLLLIGAENE